MQIKLNNFYALLFDLERCISFFKQTDQTILSYFALEMAVNRHKPKSELIFHSDGGVRYVSNRYRETLAKYGIKQSMSRKGDSYDNAAAAENFFSCLN